MNALWRGVPGARRLGRAPAPTPFSSGRKWSAATFGERGTWVLGAPEMVWRDARPTTRFVSSASRLAGGGQRVLLLARSDAALVGEELARRHARRRP